MLSMPLPQIGLVVAEDLCLTSFRVVYPSESLATALRKLRNSSHEALPVESEETHALIGILSRGDITNAYHDYLDRTAKL